MGGWLRCPFYGNSTLKTTKITTKRNCYTNKRRFPNELCALDCDYKRCFYPQNETMPLHLRTKWKAKKKSTNKCANARCTATLTLLRDWIINWTQISFISCDLHAFIWMHEVVERNAIPLLFFLCQCFFFFCFSMRSQRILFNSSGK